MSALGKQNQVWVARAGTRQPRSSHKSQNGLPPMISVMLIALAKYWTGRGASHQPAFVTISLTCFPCLASGRALVFYFLLGGW